MTLELRNHTAVTWSWQNDDDWVPFNAAIQAELEFGFFQNQKQIKVDDERYVDLSLTVCNNTT